MAKILINDGMHPSGIQKLRDAGHTVVTDRIEQDQLMDKLPDFDAICVRSATKVRADLIDNCPNLKVIGRGGVGLDNIDVEHAKSKGVAVKNTPAASSRSVAELAMGHALSLARFVHLSNRQMPEGGNSDFKSLKKSYSKGFELEGMTMGIIGFGRIGQELAKVSFGMGMNVIAHDMRPVTAKITQKVGSHEVTNEIATKDIDEVLANADIISLHVPFTGAAVLDTDAFAKMKDGVVILNAARGGTIDEAALLAALDSGKVGAAGLDVFENEPTPKQELLVHPKISCTPHIGASTSQAQEKIGLELAENIMEVLG